MPNGKDELKAHSEVEPEKTVIKALGLGGQSGGGNPTAIDVKNARIIRIRPLQYDWKPKGERHPENRGKSKFKRISWDETTDIVASELKRV